MNIPPRPVPANTVPEDRVALMTVRGFRAHCLTRPDVLAAIADAVRQRRRLIMANINVHAMAVAYHSAGMRAILNSPDTYVMIDSMPLVFLLQLLGFSVQRKHRNTSLDFYDEMFAQGAREGWRFAFVGGHQNVVDAGRAVLVARHPNLQFEGRHGYFAIDDRTAGSHQHAILEWLRDWQPDVLIIGMGMPRQEEWLAAVRDELAVPVLLPAGGYLDYQAGAQPMAPRWMGQVGLEWIFRLYHSPRRLAYRYLVEPLVVLKRIVAGPSLPVDP